MSPREELQNNIHDWIEMRSNSKFTAPYGVISSLEHIKNGKGKVRTVSFGVAAYLDATIYIYSIQNMFIKAAGPLAYKINQNKYKSYDELIESLNSI